MLHTASVAVWISLTACSKRPGCSISHSSWGAVKLTDFLKVPQELRVGETFEELKKAMVQPVKVRHIKPLKGSA